MGWRAFYKDGTEKNESDTNEDGTQKWGRPVEDGEQGNLACIAQEDFGRSVAIDLINGIVALDYNYLGVQNGTVELSDPKLMFWICDETNIVGELAHIQTSFPYAKDEYGKMIMGDDGRFVKVRFDKIIPLTWRPIWFTRYTNGVPCKIVGAQTTLPKEQGGKNTKKIITIFSDGRIGID